jgi:alpha-1,3-glucosyltransferase
MRLIVIITDLAVFAPAAIRVINSIIPANKKYFGLKYSDIVFYTLMLLPPIVFMDHGHFQFNQLMHGFVLWAVYFMMKQDMTKAVFFMVLAINFKQMALYFAIPFGVYTLALMYKSIVESPTNSIERVVK